MVPWIFASLLHLRAERVFMEPNNRRLARLVVNGDDIKPKWALRDVSFGKEAKRGAGEKLLFAGGHAEFRQGGEIAVADGARAHFNKGQGLAIVADQVEFPLGNTWSEIASDEDVAVAAKVPIRVGFATDAGLAGNLFFVNLRCAGLRTQAFAGRPTNGAKDQS